MEKENDSKCMSCSEFIGFVASWNYNVKLNFVYNILNSIAGSITWSAVFGAAYIYFLDGNSSHKNDDVGYISAVGGGVMVLMAIPVGIVTDKYPRHCSLKIGMITGILAAVSLFVALFFDKLLLLYVASGLNGLYSAVSGPALNTIFADSIPSEKRTAIYSINYACTLASGSIGPGLAVLFFVYYGNEWQTMQIRLALHSGNALALLASFILWFFHDDYSLGKESEGVLVKNDELNLKSFDSSHEVSISSSEGYISIPSENTDSNENAVLTKHNLGHQSVNLYLFELRVHHIPYIIFVSDFIIAVGAGMTVMFFGLYFANVYSLSPVSVTAIYVASPVLIAIFSIVAIPISKCLGRAPTAVAMLSLGTASLFVLSFSNIPVFVVISIYLIRTAAMNAAYPLQRSILMDIVPKSDRGKWNSLENLTAFTWTGSAALGGVLIDAHNYGFTFFITGIIYSVATVLLMLLIPLTRGEVVD